MLLRRGLHHGGWKAESRQIDATRKRIAVIDLPRKPIADIQNSAWVERINGVQRDVVVVAIRWAAARGGSQVAETVERHTQAARERAPSPQPEIAGEVVVHARVEAIIGAWALAGAEEVIGISERIRRNRVREREVLEHVQRDRVHTVARNDVARER